MSVFEQVAEKLSPDKSLIMGVVTTVTCKLQLTGGITFALSCGKMLPILVVKTAQTCCEMIFNWAVTIPLFCNETSLVGVLLNPLFCISSRTASFEILLLPVSACKLAFCYNNRLTNLSCFFNFNIYFVLTWQCNYDKTATKV